MGLWKRLSVWAEFVKFEHTVFALPFAYLGFVLGSLGREIDGYRESLAWITVAMFGARTLGMALNRIVDLRIDAKNPRTARRPLVTGRVSFFEAYVITVVAFGAFLAAAFHFGALCRALFVPALGVIVLYHFMKRFTWLCHYGVGLVLACAPAGGWFAASGNWDWRFLPLSAAVMFWTAGFDLLYSLQDMEFDRANGLHSVPARYGRPAALLQSRFCHAVTVGALWILGIIMDLGAAYSAIVAASAALLAFEHILVFKDEKEVFEDGFFYNERGF